MWGQLSNLTQSIMEKAENLTQEMDGQLVGSHFSCLLKAFVDIQTISTALHQRCPIRAAQEHARQGLGNLASSVLHVEPGQVMRAATSHCASFNRLRYKHEYLPRVAQRSDGDISRSIGGPHTLHHACRSLTGLKEPCLVALHKHLNQQRAQPCRAGQTI